MRGGQGGPNEAARLYRPLGEPSASQGGAARRWLLVGSRRVALFRAARMLKPLLPLSLAVRRGGAQGKTYNENDLVRATAGSDDEERGRRK